MGVGSKVGGLGSEAEIGKTLYIGFAGHGGFKINVYAGASPLRPLARPALPSKEGA